MSVPPRTVSVSLAAVLVALLLALVVLLDCLGSARGQSYHYSNGWNPGKKRGGHPLTEDPHLLTEVPRSAATALYNGLLLPAELHCRQRHHVLREISQLITDEIARLERSCSSDEAVHFLKMLIERSSRQQQVPPEGRTQLDLEEEEEAEGRNRW